MARRKYNRPIIMWRQRVSVNLEFFPVDINCSQIASPMRGDLNWFRINRIAWEGEEFPRKCAVCPIAGRVVNQLHTHHVPLRIAPRVCHTCQIIFAARSRDFTISLIQAELPILSSQRPDFAIPFYRNYKRKS